MCSHRDCIADKQCSGSRCSCLCANSGEFVLEAGIRVHHAVDTWKS